MCRQKQMTNKKTKKKLNRFFFQLQFCHDHFSFFKETFIAKEAPHNFPKIGFLHKIKLP